MKKTENKKAMKKAIWRDIMYIMVWWIFAFALDELDWAYDFKNYVEDIIFEVLYPFHLGSGASEMVTIILMFAALAGLLSFAFHYIANFVEGLFNK